MSLAWLYHCCSLWICILYIYIIITHRLYAYFTGCSYVTTYTSDIYSNALLSPLMMNNRALSGVTLTNNLQIMWVADSGLWGFRVVLQCGQTLQAAIIVRSDHQVKGSHLPMQGVIAQRLVTVAFPREECLARAILFIYTVHRMWLHWLE